MHPRLLTTPFFTLQRSACCSPPRIWHRVLVLMAPRRREPARSRRARFARRGRSSARSRREGAAGDPSRSSGLPRVAGRLFPSRSSSAGDFYGGFIGALIASAIFFWRIRVCRSGARPSLRSGDRARSGDRSHRVLHGRRRLRAAGQLPWAVTFTGSRRGAVSAALRWASRFIPCSCTSRSSVCCCSGPRSCGSRAASGSTARSSRLHRRCTRSHDSFSSSFRGDADRGFVFGGCAVDVAIHRGRSRSVRGRAVVRSPSRRRGRAYRPFAPRLTSAAIAAISSPGSTGFARWT